MTRSTRRRGVTLFELITAILIVAAAMGGMVQLLALTAVQRRNLEHRRVALQEVANQAERIALLPWDETAKGRLTAWQPSADLQRLLPAAACTAEVTDEPGPPTSRRIRLLVSWPNTVGQMVDPVALTIWKFQPGGTP